MVHTFPPATTGVHKSMHTSVHMACDPAVRSDVCWADLARKKYITTYHAPMNSTTGSRREATRMPGSRAGGAGASPETPPDAFGNSTLDAPLAQELADTIRSMHPAFAHLTVSPGIRKGRRCYIQNVDGEGANHCINKGAAHGRSKIYFIVTRNGVCQKCFAGRSTGGPCANFRSAPVPITQTLRDALFGRGAVAGRQATPRARPTTLAAPLLNPSLLGNDARTAETPPPPPTPPPSPSDSACWPAVSSPATRSAPPLMATEPKRRGKRKAKPTTAEPDAKLLVGADRDVREPLAAERRAAQS